MTAGYYDEDIADALEMIQEFGVQCMWSKATVALDDSTQPWLGGDDVPNVKEPFICFVPATTTASSGFGLTKFRPEGEVPSFRQFGLMGAQDFEPEISDKVLGPDGPLVLAAVDKLAPNGQTVLYILSIV